ncbi:MAG TPA: LppP/LprE family lipoprotein [Vicinamibacterales bacterium]|nr:LppP/LprE family lipoprotein [Vicinamibacterales bacterium]
MRAILLPLLAATLLMPAVLARAGTLWLDGPLAPWNQSATVIPSALGGTESQGALERRCGSASLTASPAAAAVRAAGWAPFLHFDRAIARDGVEVVGGMTAAATPGCEPVMFNLFVFVGGTFAGTISPIVMEQGRDAAVGAVRVTGADALTAEFARYTTKDTTCCPSSRVRVTYRIERSGSQPTLVPVDIRTLR